MSVYDLPNWLPGVMVIGSMTVTSMVLYFAFHRILKPVITEEHTGLAMAVLAVVATLNSLLLAFSAVSGRQGKHLLGAVRKHAGEHGKVGS